jgi:hypothetical protein
MKVIMNVQQSFACFNMTLCHSVAQAVSCWCLTAEAQVCAHVRPCGICCGQSGIGTGVSLEFFGLLLSVSCHHGSILISSGGPGGRVSGT